MQILVIIYEGRSVKSMHKCDSTMQDDFASFTCTKTVYSSMQVDPSELTEPDGPALRGIREALTVHHTPYSAHSRPGDLSFLLVLM